MSELTLEKRLELVEEHLSYLEARERDNGKTWHGRHERLSEDVGKLSRIIDNIAQSVDILEGRFEHLLKMESLAAKAGEDNNTRLQLDNLDDRLRTLEARFEGSSEAVRLHTALAAQSGGDGEGSWNEQLDKCLGKLDALASPAGPEVPGALMPEKEHELREACRMLRQIWDGGHVRPNSSERMKLVCLAMPGIIDELVALRARLAATEAKP